MLKRYFNRRKQFKKCVNCLFVDIDYNYYMYKSKIEGYCWISHKNISLLEKCDIKDEIKNVYQIIYNRCKDCNNMNSNKYCHEIRDYIFNIPYCSIHERLVSKN